MPSKKIFFVCMYKMVDISVETWNKAKVSVIKIHENDNVNKTLLKSAYSSRFITYKLGLS